MFPFIYRRQTVQAQPGPRRGHTETGSGGGRAVPPVEDGVLIGRRAAAGQAVGRRTDGQTGPGARRRALLNLRVKGAIELPLLIVHLTQDHVVLQEELVSHTKSGKSKQEREDMEGSQRVEGSSTQDPAWPGGGHMGREVLWSFLLDLSRGDPQIPGLAEPSARPCSLANRIDRQAWASGLPHAAPPWRDGVSGKGRE